MKDIVKEKTGDGELELDDINDDEIDQVWTMSVVL